jgi:hypothetical protein
MSSSSQPSPEQASDTPVVNKFRRSALWDNFEAKWYEWKALSADSDKLVKTMGGPNTKPGAIAYQENGKNQSKFD